MSNRAKRNIAISLLVVIFCIVKLFLGGTRFYFDELVPELITFAIITIVLMIVPIIFRLVNKSRLEFKKGNIVCILNSLIIYIVFAIPNIKTIIKGNDNIGTNSVDPVMLAESLLIIFFIIAAAYYFINMFFFVNNKKGNSK